LGKRHVRLEPGKMREQVAQRDRALAALKFRNVIGDLIVEPELTLFE